MCTTNTVIHIFPPDGQNYGCIFWGFKGESNFQGGMNEYGLFFDGAGTGRVKMTKPDLPSFDGNFVFEEALRKCKTVEEAIALIKNYRMPYLEFSHLLLADADGDAAIVEWGNDKLNFIRKGQSDFLIATNFNLTESDSPEGNCARYDTAKRMLNGAEPSVGLFEKILSVTHAEGNFPTVYSTICDLKNQRIYLYNFHNYSFRKEIGLKEEFRKGEREYMVRSFFPVTNAELIFRLKNDCIDDFENLPQREVTFKVVTEKPIPDFKLFVCGSAKEIGHWDEPGVELSKIDKTHFQKTISFREGKLFDFALNTGQDNFVLFNEFGKEISEQAIDVKKDTTVVIKISAWKKK